MQKLFKDTLMDTRGNEGDPIPVSLDLDFENNSLMALDESGVLREHTVTELFGYTPVVRSYVDLSGAIRKAPHNLFLHSADITNAAWIKTRTTVAVETKTGPIINGVPTGDVPCCIVYEDSNGGAKNIGQTSIIRINEKLSLKFYVKRNVGNRWIRIVAAPDNGTAYRAHVEPVTGGGLNLYDSVPSRLTVNRRDLPDGWVEVEFIYNPTMNASFTMYIGFTDSIDGGASISDPDTSNNVSFYNLQLEHNPSASLSHVPTTDTVLAERVVVRNPLRPIASGLWGYNEILYKTKSSRDFSSLPWEKSAVTVTETTDWSPTGRCWKVEVTATGSIVRLRQQVAAASAPDGMYSLTIVAKYGNVSKVSLFYDPDGNGKYPGSRYEIDLETGVVSNPTGATDATFTVDKMAKGWWAITVTIDKSGTGDMGFSIVPLTTTKNSPEAGDIGKYMFVAHAQMTNTNYPAPLENTTVDPRAFAADWSKITGPLFNRIWNPNGATLYADFVSNKEAGYRNVVSVNDGSTTNYLLQIGLTGVSPFGVTTYNRTPLGERTSNFGGYTPGLRTQAIVSSSLATPTVHGKAGTVNRPEGVVGLPSGVNTLSIAGRWGGNAIDGPIKRVSLSKAPLSGSTALSMMKPSPRKGMDFLFEGNQEGGAWDFSRLDTMFQDDAGKIPVREHGDPVALVYDISGNGRHLYQTVSAFRPIYQTDGVEHWLAFDGVDDCMHVDMPTITNSYTIAVSGRYGTPTVSECLMGVDSENYGRAVLFLRTGTVNRFGAGRGFSNASSGAALPDITVGRFPTNCPFVAMSKVIKGEASRLYANGAQVAEGTASTSSISAQKWTLGNSQNQYIGYYSGKMHGAALLTRDISEDNRRRLERVMGALSGKGF